jgi:hypothetical protein
MTGRAVGAITRGTTAARRLRRVDRWLLATQPGLLRRRDLVVIDVGFGERPTTTLELAHQLRQLNPTARVVGLDISAERVAAAQAFARPGVEFAVGGFELGGRRADVVRAFNVLREYDEADVAAAWQRMTAQLSTGGLLLEGTCDETGGLGSWITLEDAGPRTLTLAVDVSIEPSAVAARLPKALIHHNVPGQPIHRLLTDLDHASRTRMPLRVFGHRQLFAAAVRDIRAAGWPVVDGPTRWRRGELTLAWRAVMSRPR